MTWLTQLTLDHATVARRRLRDNYDWHQVAWECFPNRPGDTRNFLFRIDESAQGFRLLIVSPQMASRPDWCAADVWKSEEIPPQYFGRARYAFQLRANPTRKVVNREKPQSIDTNGRINRNRNSRRIALRQPVDLARWLERKAAAGGFAVEPDSLRIIPEGEDYFRRGSQHGAHASVEFRGTLRVTDTAKFRETFAAGLGSAKAFGFGLLVIAPLN